MVSNNNDLLSLLCDTVLKYGIGGNKSLEYIGLTLENKKAISPKIYLIPDNTKSMPMWVRKIWELYFIKFLNEFDIKICDVSESYLNQIPTYRMVIKFKINPAMTQIYILEDLLSHFIGKKELERFEQILSDVHQYDCLNTSPLIQLGVETDHKYNILSFKYYLTLKNNPFKRPVILPETIKLINEIQPSKNNENCITFSLLRRIEKCGYYPTFIGVNDSGDLYECKLYYISSLYGRSFMEKAADQIKEICITLNLGSEIQSVLIDSFEKAHIYPEGIAVSSYIPNTIRMYLKEISPRILKIIN